MTSKLIVKTLGALTMFGCMALSAPNAKTDDNPIAIGLEQPATAEMIKDVATRGSPIEVWETLEHGERVECLDCLSYVEPLLFDKDARVREIAAWWIRRRPFGYAEIALRVRDTVVKDADPARRAAAASALGEFLDTGATPLVMKAAIDSDASVRLAAMGALRRLNDVDSAPTIATALADGDVAVRKAAIDAATHVSGFTDTGAMAKLVSDPDASVRAKACDALAGFKVKGAVGGLAAVSKTDPDEEVRIAAVNALGEIGDASGKSAVEAATSDSSSRVRDAAKVAQLKLTGSL